MFKKYLGITLLSLMAIVMIVIVINPLARALEPQFYVGGELGTTTPHYIKVDGRKHPLQRTNSNLGGFVGTMLHEHFGLEAGYNYTLRIKDVDEGASASSIQISNLYADAAHHICLADSLDGFAFIGISRASLNSKNTHEAKTNWRVGLGILYAIDDNFGLRLKFAYQNVSKGYLKRTLFTNLGLSYTF